jgi:hypothetical protein
MIAEPLEGSLKMKTEIVKRKFIQKKIKEQYKKFKDHKDYKLSKVFHLGDVAESACNWSISIERRKGWEAAADFIRPHIIELRKQYRLENE